MKTEQIMQKLSAAIVLIGEAYKLLLDDRYTLTVAYDIDEEQGSSQGREDSYAARREDVKLVYIEDLQKQHNNGNTVHKIISLTPQQIIEEVKKMIIELKIKGSVREHKNGLIRFTSTIFGDIYGRSKEEIEEKLKEKIKQFKRKKPQKEKKKNTILLSEFFEKDYFLYKQQQGLARGSLDEIKRLVSFIISQGFDKPLNVYKAKEIEEFLYSVPQTSKRKKLKDIFNNMFNRALSLSYIKANPCMSIEKVKHVKKQGTAFTFDEQEDFFKRLFASELSHMQKCYYVLLYLCGARRNEALGIKVADVDFKNKVLTIHGTKTAGSDRRVPLTPLMEKLFLSLKTKNGFFFPMRSDTADHAFRSVWEKEKGHKLHDLRHTYGTIQICVEKLDVKSVSLLMGHSTIDTTVSIYTHPEQLDCGTFLRGDISPQKKVSVYRKKYESVLQVIKNFFD